jgi:hypothetical protein
VNEVNLPWGAGTPSDVLVRPDEEELVAPGVVLGRLQDRQWDPETGGVGYEVGDVVGECAEGADERERSTEVIEQ